MASLTPTNDMKRNLAWFIFVLASAAVASQPTRSRQTPTRYTDVDAFDVYSAVMPRPISGKAVLVVNTTTKPETCSLTDADIANIPNADFREAMQDYRRANNELWILAGEFRGPVKADFVDRKELDSYFRKGADKGWKRFYGAHPNASGTVAFSAVGFNDKHIAAVVYVEIVSCSECAVGGLHLLQKGTNGWTEIKPDLTNCGWIS
jgi:hypothetical protein